MSDIKAVLFDLDNTLIDFMSMKKTCSKAAVEAMVAAGLPISPKKAYDLLMKTYFEIGIEHERIFQEFLQRVDNKIDYKILSAGIVAYRRAQMGVMKPYPNVIPTMIRLREKGIKLALVTDAPKIKAWIRLTELGLQDFFDFVVAFDDTGERKPSKLPFSKALKLLSCSPENALMVGDWPERDIAGAKALGMHTCFARYGYDKKGQPVSGADFEIDQIADLLRIV